MFHHMAFLSIPEPSVMTAWVPRTRRPKRTSPTVNTVPTTVCGWLAGRSSQILRTSVKSLKRRGKRKTASPTVATPRRSKRSTATLPTPGRRVTGNRGGASAPTALRGLGDGVARLDFVLGLRRGGEACCPVRVGCAGAPGGPALTPRPRCRLRVAGAGTRAGEALERGSVVSTQAVRSSSLRER